jgi:5-formyltetrahydrofolate cyclo-ligase
LDGKTLFVPRVGLDFEQCDMDLIRVPSRDVKSSGINDKMFYSEWPKNKWGIPEAPFSPEYEIAKPGDIDLLIVPGLGFDANGGRLGQGKGYYDRFIHKMRDDGKGKPLLVAVGLEPSFVDDEEGIPMMDHDFRMDLVVLPNGNHNVDDNLKNKRP